MRRWLNMRDAFPRSADEHAQQVVRLLQHRREDMDATWTELEEGSKAINDRMVECGLSARTSDEGAVRLNVGGSNVNVCWHLLAEAEGFKESILGGLLEVVWGEGQIPRDADGRIVLDESPACIKHIVHTILRDSSSGRVSSVAAVGLSDSATRSAVAIDEAPYLMYTAHVMGLPGYVPSNPKYLNMDGVSTILEPFEIAPLGAKIREWVGGSVEQMTLIYRATRDGFDAKSFKPRCNEGRPHTVSLIRVRSGRENVDDSIVGGYSVLPWGNDVKSEQSITAETFVFMLKDGSATRKDPSKPTKWGPYPKRVGRIFTIEKEFCGVSVGGNDLHVSLRRETGAYTLKSGRDTFDIEEDSPFLALESNKVVDVEVYRCWTSAPHTATTASSTTDEPDGTALTDAEAYDIELFGKSIASSLMEERVVLARAVREMEAAGARVSAAANSLQAIYGPDVAAGEQDAVVELNVRETRMTTLRSTLQACPRSALATMFDEDRWPATDNDKDEHGRRLIDCNPIYFSKILDVLRMRKRASWSQRSIPENQEGKEKGKEKEKGGGGEEWEVEEKKGESTNGGSGAVLIKRAGAEAFGSAVNMYFPGCEKFIMGLVQPM